MYERKIYNLYVRIYFASAYGKCEFGEIRKISLIYEAKICAFV